MSDVWVGLVLVLIGAGGLGVVVGMFVTERHEMVPEQPTDDKP